MGNLIDEQKIAFQIFNNSIKKDKLSHAYIIETNGYSKSYDFITYMINKILSIKSNTNNSELIKSNSHPDLMILSTNNLLYKKEDIRKLNQEFKTKPIKGKYKVYLIKDADKLNINLSNSLLKFVEEPEEGIVAIFMVENKYQLINTLISRCQIISMRNNIENNDIYTYYKNNNYNIENIEDDLKNVLSVAICIERNKSGTILYENKLIHNIYKDKEDIKKMLDLMKLVYVESLKQKNGIKISYLDRYSDLLKKIAKINNNEQLIKKINIIIKNIEKLYYNININLLIDSIIIELGGV